MAARVRIGDVEIICVSDGRLRSSIDCVRDVNRETALQISGADDDGAIWIPVQNFLFQRDGAWVMVDAGGGTGMQLTLGRLPEELRHMGTPPHAITHILLTHLHSDHANGLIDAAGAALYPGAELMIPAAEHAFWTRINDNADTDAVKRTRARTKLNLAAYQGRIRLVNEGQSVLGCDAVAAPGHTPGHTCWRITTGAEPLLACGDVVHFESIQLQRPEIAVTYDLDPDRARDTRMAFLSRAASENVMVAGAHLGGAVGGTGIGVITRRSFGFAFMPAGV